MGKMSDSSSVFLTVLQTWTAGRCWTQEQRGPCVCTWTEPTRRTSSCPAPPRSSGSCWRAAAGTTPWSSSAASTAWCRRRMLSHHETASLRQAILALNHTTAHLHEVVPYFVKIYKSEHESRNSEFPFQMNWFYVKMACRSVSWSMRSRSLKEAFSSVLALTSQGFDLQLRNQLLVFTTLIAENPNCPLIVSTTDLNKSLL